MPWVVKEWRCVADAERDARRVRRAAAREVLDAEAHLTVIEDLAGELLAAMRARQAPAPGRAGGRASLRESPLTELFRATDLRAPAGYPHHD